MQVPTLYLAIAGDRKKFNASFNFYSNATVKFVIIHMQNLLLNVLLGNSTNH